MMKTTREKVKILFAGFILSKCFLMRLRLSFSAFSLFGSNRRISLHNQLCRFHPSHSAPLRRR